MKSTAGNHEHKGLQKERRIQAIFFLTLLTMQNLKICISKCLSLHLKPVIFPTLFQFCWCNKYDGSEQQSMSHKQLCTQNQLMITFNNYYRYFAFLNN